MAVHQEITREQVEAYRRMVSQDGVAGAIKAYRELYDQGYGYAGWALGVATGETITGQAALEYMQNSSGSEISPERIDQIRIDMAEGYLNALLAKIEANHGNPINEDLKFDLIKDFHEKVFEKNGLSLENWTLNTPSEFIEKYYGKEMMEKIWKELSETGGEGIAGIIGSSNFLMMMLDFADGVIVVNDNGEYVYDPNSDYSKIMDNLPNIKEANIADVEAAQAWLNNNGILAAFLNWVRTVVTDDNLPEKLKSLLDLLNGDNDGIPDEDFGDWGFDSDILHELNEDTPSIDKAEEQASPIVIDLDGDGVETISRSQDIHFDLNNDGFAEQTGWVNADDGLLVLDLNGNNKIDNGSELFGNYTAQDGSNANNGFEALKQYDDNGDGMIDALDSIWQKLMIWQDINQNGVSEANELKPITTAVGENGAISAVYLDYIDSEYVDGNKNQYRQMGMVKWESGKESGAVDVWFNVNNSDTIYASEGQWHEEIAALPDASAFGKVLNLRDAMMQDPILYGLVQQYIEQPSTSLLYKMIYQWTGASDVPIDDRGPYIDARQLVALEHLTGRDYLQYLSHNPGPNAGKILRAEFAKFPDYVAAQIKLQTIYADVADELYTEKTDFGGNVIKFPVVYIDLISAAASGNAMWAKDAVKTIRDLFTYAPSLQKDFMDGLELAAINLYQKIGSADILYIINGVYPVIGDDGDNILTSDSLIDDNNTLPSNQNNNTHSNVILIGRKGNDALYGNQNNNTYIFSKGDGQDIISDSGGYDNLIFDVNSAQVHWGRLGDYLIIQYCENDVVRVNHFFDTNNYKIENFSFSDKIISLSKTPFNDGHNTVYGDSGSNFLIGGKGDDTLIGKTGDDLYFISNGDGRDTIQDDGGYDVLCFSDVRLLEIIFVRTDDYHLALSYGDNNKVTVKNFFTYSDRYQYQIEEFQFADQVVKLGGEAILQGSSGDDVITSIFLFKSHFIGGAGDDIFENNGQANSIYTFGNGDGKDVIKNYGESSVIRFTDGITPADLQFQANGRNLIIQLGENNQIKILGMCWNGMAIGGVEIQFSDGTLWHDEDINRIIMVNNTLMGTLQNDTIEGTDNDEILIGGLSNDYLLGGGGKDSYHIGKESGIDVIQEESSSNETNVIQLDEGIGLSDLMFLVVNGALIVAQDKNNFTIVLGFFSWLDYNSAYKQYYPEAQNNHDVFVLQLADGTTLTKQDILPLLTTNYADAAKMVQSIFYRSQNIVGEAGNDTGVESSMTYYSNGRMSTVDYADFMLMPSEVGSIVGQGGDTFVCGHLLSGEIYSSSVMNHGMGADLKPFNLVFLEGVTAANLLFKREGDLLIIDGVGESRFGETVSGRMYFYPYFDESQFAGIDTIYFDDGSTLNTQDIIRLIHTISATDDNGDYLTALPEDSVLIGGNGDDYLVGNTGNDRLNGGNGNDYYRIEPNGGRDTIQEISGDDTVEFVDVNVTDILVLREGDDLILRLLNNIDEVRIAGSFADEAAQVEYFQFADQTLNLADLLALMDSGSVDPVDPVDPKPTNTPPAVGEPLAAVTMLIGSVAGFRLPENAFTDVDGDSLTFRATLENGEALPEWLKFDPDTKMFSGAVPSDSRNEYNVVVTATDSHGASVSQTWLLMALQIDYTEAPRTEGTNSDDIIPELQWQPATGRHINGNDGNDIIYGTQYDDVLNGGNHNDILYGGTGNDTLIGGVGNDYLSGGAGADVYEFSRGHGSDIVSEMNTTGINTIRFTDLNADEIT
ncbi:calcium-binding protein, partial [Stenoxybacter acetivorans]|uniref:calcium-binding protein n=1 Tax=Stenoxybacter acetivorans TaxID=422441 RepID=UPI00055EA093